MDSEILIFRNRDILMKVDISNVVYFEADGNFTKIVTRNKAARSVYLNLGQMDSLLKNASLKSAMDFVRIGRCFVVNIRYIHLIDILRKELILSDCTNFTFKLDCSREALKQLREMQRESTDENSLLIECGNNSSAKPTDSDNIR